MATTESNVTTTDAHGLLAMGAGRRELIRGEVMEMTPAGGRHGRIAMKLALHIANFVEREGLGLVYAAETGFLIEQDPDTVRAPDVAYVERSRVVETEAYPPLAPDLVVEVISPSDPFSEVLSKAQMWLDCGTQLVWLVDPATRRVFIRRADGTSDERGRDGLLSGEQVLPGFDLPLEQVF